MQEKIRPGYKQTEIGVIPEDWEYTTLGNFVSIRRGHDLTARQRRRGIVPVMGSAGQNGFHDTALANGPGVVIGRSGASFGQAHYCESDYWPHNTALYVTDFLGNDPLFVFYFLRAMDFSQHNSGGAQQSLNRNFIAPIQIAIPSPEEQKEIVGALRDADALIASLEALIAKKRDLKQATRQQLLTGKTRLPGFSGEWEVKRLEELCEVDPQNLGAGTDPAYTFKYIALEDVDSGQLLGFTEMEFRSAPSRARRKLRLDDVLISTVRPNLQAHLHFRQDSEDWVCSTGFAVLRCIEGRSSAGFIVQHLFGNCINQQINKLITGSNYPAISSSDVRSLELPTPSIEEQTAIAEVLSDMDADLAALEARRDKSRAVKHGMMQELLTGRVRLV